MRRATIGEYDIYSQLGRGGMATVFLALELSLNRRVAIKVISPSALSSTTVIDRFWLEARTAASLSHPHVIPIFAVKSVAGLHFFVMKHIQGGSLDAVLRTEGAFSFSLARTILGEVSGALAYAHRRGVIHRDIKPANIMLDDEGFAIVMDFGIAKVRDVAALTASGAMVGTPFYMSPEQFNGGEVDGRSDQYSLGVVAFELLTGRRPFKGETVPEVLRGHLLDKVPDIRDFRADCPTSLATLVNRMLAKSASDRFPSMEMLCAQLDAMPRIDADKVRKKMISLARTASLEKPQITQPVSPSPMSRTSAERILASTPLAAPSGIASAAATIRRRPWVSGATAAAAIGIAVLVLAANKGDTQRTDQNARDDTSIPANQTAAFRAAPVSASAPRSTILSMDSGGVADHPQLGLERQSQERSRSSSTRPPVQNKSVQSTVRAQAPTTSDSRVTSRDDIAEKPERIDDPSPSVALVDQHAVVPAPVVPPPRPQTAFGIGSRIPAAFLYIDGQLVGRISRLGIFPHQPGRVHLQIRADDCLTWDSVVVLAEGDTALIGYRNPRCTK